MAETSRRPESFGTRKSDEDSMNDKRQQGEAKQMELFQSENASRPGGNSEGGTGTEPHEEPQADTVSTKRRTLATGLMEKVCNDTNLLQAYKRVKANKGGPGVDGMTVYDLARWLDTHKGELVASLLDGTYKPPPVKGVEIPKPGGGMRQLGIPTVIDRLVQQAILQVLGPVLEPTFSESSFGFRPGRSAHDALKQAKEYVEDDRIIVVDIDLEKFFDRVNHDMLMARVARHVGDKKLLKLIRAFVEAGLMRNGVCVRREEGTPQGGPLSPLLANLLLDDLDKELEKRGHKFCRYADDCNIYVRSQEAGERVMASVTKFLEKKLKLKVNREKSAVAPVWERKFLGHRLLPNGELGIAPKSIKRMKERVKEITRRKRGVSPAVMIRELNEYLIGWVTYFRHAKCKTHLERLDQWIRHKLRCVILKQCKGTKAIADFLRKLGICENLAWRLALSGKGWWRLSNTPQANMAMSPAWFETQGLLCLTTRFLSLQLPKETAVYENVRTVV